MYVNVIFHLFSCDLWSILIYIIDWSGSSDDQIVL